LTETGPHKLEKTWALWFKGGKPAGGKGGGGGGKVGQWDGSCGTKAFTFNTAEDFWCMYNNIHRASQLPDRSDYMLFVDGIRPEYEDPVSEND
jgi:translation initiation factor 4E